MSTTNYNASLRGKLVNVSADNSVRTYGSPSSAGKTDDYVTGPETLGTATGYTTVDGATIFIEVLRVNTVLLVSYPTKMYFHRDQVVTADNPLYDPSKDLDRPSDSTTGGDTTGTTKPYSNGDIDVVVEKETKDTTTDRLPIGTENDGMSTQRKWLTYGLYAILGIAAITLTVILIKSAKTPNVKKL
jgi:hypothetical protein